MKDRRFIIAAIVLAGVTLPVKAGPATQALHDFLKNTQSVKAHFKQTVRDKDARVIQNVSGTMMFMRPGKFRWEYQKPYEQIIVGDGEKLWVHDPELNQVTVKTLDQAMGDTPAALLAGSREIESSFVLKDLPDRGEMHWLEAIPKTPEGAFEKIRIGFHGNDLETMELDDHFYQTTVILFSGTEPNLRLPSSLFHFTPPVGADVISD